MKTRVKSIIGLCLLLGGLTLGAWVWLTRISGVAEAGRVALRQRVIGHIAGIEGIHNRRAGIGAVAGGDFRRHGDVGAGDCAGIARSGY